MVGKKGWLRIIEATICVLIILGIVLLIKQEYRADQNSYDFNKLNMILEEINKNDSLRHSIFNDEVTTVEISINEILIQKINRPDISSQVRVCNPLDPCTIQSLDSDVYVFSRIISVLSNESQYDGSKIKVVKVYAWESN